MPLLEEEYRKEEKINGVIYDMSPSPNYQHGLVDGNIYSIIKSGLKGTLCLVFMENLDYKYHAQENNDYVIPDVMIICDRKHLKGGSYTGTPRFIVETLSPATALRDMTVKKEIYQAAGVEEYWIVDWRTKTIEIYELDYDENDIPQYYLWKTISEENKDELRLVHFPNIKITFEDLFDEIDY